MARCVPRQLMAACRGLQCATVHLLCLSPVLCPAGQQLIVLLRHREAEKLACALCSNHLDYPSIEALIKVRLPCSQHLM